MSIQFLDTTFQTPIILASSPLTETIHNIRRCEDLGAGGAILKTSCEFQRKEAYEPRKYVFAPDRSCYYASSSFEREILTSEEGLFLYKNASSTCKIPIIPSVTALSLEPYDWLPLCKAYQNAGATIIQLDFFYLGISLKEPDFEKKLYALLTTLGKNLSCHIMPKVNVDLPADYIFHLFSKAGIRGVSLLDSVRVPGPATPDGDSLPFSSTSCFGPWQLPLSLHYASIASQYSLEICGGGGVCEKESVLRMQSCGASLVQVASAILMGGYEKLSELLSPLYKTSAMPDTHIREER